MDAMERRDRVADVVVAVRGRAAARAPRRRLVRSRAAAAGAVEPVAIASNGARAGSGRADVLLAERVLHVVAGWQGHAHDEQMVRMVVAWVASDRLDTLEAGNPP